jgi:phage/plasmid-associated DNA primase
MPDLDQTGTPGGRFRVQQKKTDGDAQQQAKSHGAAARKKGYGTAAQGQARTSGRAGGATGLTEDELALEFTRRHRDRFRHVASWGVWMKWTGCRWQREPTQEVFDLARKVCRDAGKGLGNAKLRARILSASTRAAVESLARSDRAHAAVPEQWDRDLFALNEPRSPP